MKTSTDDSKHPHWWNDQHTSAWTRVREAMHRDWEQTKADFSKNKGENLGQTAGDTVAQATGKKPVPPEGTPTTHEKNDTHAAWTKAEPAVRYGYGARSHYADASAWDDSLEAKMRKDWDSLGGGDTWDDARAHVRHGWDAAKNRT